jgi:hypothetical protein
MIIDCISKAIFLFVIYNVISLIIFGIPKSLSATYYLFESVKPSLKVLFPAMIVLLVILLMPCWLEISKNSPFQFTAFLSIASLLFVAITPAYNKSKADDKVHTVSAIISCIFALIWIILVPKLWYIIVVTFIIFSIIAIITKTYKTSCVYWLELTSIISTFISIIIYYISQIK